MGTYTPAMRLAQIDWCLEHGVRLPNASGPGLSILPGTPCYPYDKRTKDAWIEEQATLDRTVDPKDLIAAKDALAEQLEARNYAAGGGPGYADESANAIAAGHFPSWYEGPDAAAQRPALEESLEASLVGYDGATIDTVVPV